MKIQVFQITMFVYHSNSKVRLLKENVLQRFSYFSTTRRQLPNVRKNLFASPNSCLPSCLPGNSVLLLSGHVKFSAGRCVARPGVGTASFSVRNKEINLPSFSSGTASLIYRLAVAASAALVWVLGHLIIG